MKITVKIAVGIDHFGRVNAIACHSLNSEDRFGSAIEACRTGLVGNPNVFYVMAHLEVPEVPSELDTVQGVVEPVLPVSSDVGRTNPDPE